MFSLIILLLAASASARPASGNGPSGNGPAETNVVAGLLDNIQASTTGTSSTAPPLGPTDAPADMDNMRETGETVPLEVFGNALNGQSSTTTPAPATTFMLAAATTGAATDEATTDATVDATAASTAPTPAPTTTTPAAVAVAIASVDIAAGSAAADSKPSVLVESPPAAEPAPAAIAPADKSAVEPDSASADGASADGASPATPNEEGIASASAGFEKTGAGGGAASDNSASVGAGVATALVMVACAIAIVAAVLHKKRKAPPASVEDVVAASEDRALDNQMYASIEENKDFDFCTIEAELGSVSSQIEKRASQRASGKNKAFVAASLAGFGAADATVYESNEELEESSAAINAVAVEALAAAVHDYADHADSVEPMYACPDANSSA